MSLGASPFGGVGASLQQGIDALQAKLDGILADQPPSSEASAAKAGTQPLASRMDHVHPRITWSGLATTDTNGVCSFDFSAKAFDVQPVAILSYYENSTTTQPVALRVSAWTLGTGALAGRYVGCTVKAMRSQAIPQGLVALLVGGVFNLFAASASGVQVNLVLLPQSVSV